MADVFKRVLAATIPQTFAANAAPNAGRVRIYSVGEGGILLGNATTTWGYGLDGVLGGQRARSATEAQWGIPSGFYSGSDRPTPVGRLSNGYTLYSAPTSPQLIATSFLLSLGPQGTDGLELTGLTGRYYVSCCMTGDGSHVMVFTRASASSAGAVVEMWHLMQWTGTIFVMVREGTIDSSSLLSQYLLGPGSSAADHFGAAMLERDLVTLWRFYAPGNSVYVLRIGADNVMRQVKMFTGAEGIDGGFYLGSIYADRGRAAVVVGNQLYLFQSRDPEPPVEVYKPPRVDIGLHQVDNGVFDLQFFDVVDGNDTHYIETLVYAVLFTDAEAPTGREPDRYLRRGWWLAADSGCGLWHVRRQPLGSAARLEAVELVRTVLEAHGLTDLSVTERSPAGVSGVVLDITGLYRDRSFLVSVPL